MKHIIEITETTTKITEIEIEVKNENEGEKFGEEIASNEGIYQNENEILTDLNNLGATIKNVYEVLEKNELEITRI